MTPQEQGYAHAAIKVFTAADEEPWEDGRARLLEQIEDLRDAGA